MKSAKSTLIKELFIMIREKRLTDIQDFLYELDTELVLELPSLYDMDQEGKSLLHACAKVKSVIILEELIEFYRKKYTELLF